MISHMQIPNEYLLKSQHNDACSSSACSESRRSHVSLLVSFALRQQLRRHPVHGAHSVHAALLCFLERGQADVTHLQCRKHQRSNAWRENVPPVRCAHLESQVVVDQQVETF